MKEGIRYSSAERVGGRHKFFPQTVESLGEFVRQGYKWCRDEASFNQINYGKKQNSLMRGFLVAGAVNTHLAKQLFVFYNSSHGLQISISLRKRALTIAKLHKIFENHREIGQNIPIHNSI